MSTRTSAVPAGRLLEPVVAGLCQYEVAAILSRGRLAPLTRVSRDHKWVAPLLVGGLAVHLYLDCWRSPGAPGDRRTAG